jgi:hypothetical protein
MPFNRFPVNYEIIATNQIFRLALIPSEKDVTRKEKKLAITGMIVEGKLAAR